MIHLCEHLSGWILRTSACVCCDCGAMAKEEDAQEMRMALQNPLCLHLSGWTVVTSSCVCCDCGAIANEEDAQDTRVAAESATTPMASAPAAEGASPAPSLPTAGSCHT